MRRIRRVAQAASEPARIAAFNTRLIDDRPRLLGLGDSHIEVLRDVRPLLPGVRVDYLMVRGATAQGVVNPNSQTDALRLFVRRLERARPWQHLVLQLGEVDCGFVIWYRAAKHGIPVGEQLAVSLGNYLRFIDEHTARFERVTVLSAPLPTIPDVGAVGEVAHSRSAITTSAKDRTGLTLEYNARLQAALDDRSARFLDVTSGQLDPVTGLVRDELRHPDPGNHHLHPERYAALVALALSAVL